MNGKVLNNIIATQSVHENYGGVVPELASRAHQQNIVPVVDEALKSAGIDKKSLSAIAFTRGPGLMGALLVGTSFAKSMALALDIPLIEVNHMQAHILAHFIDEPKPEFPFLCLTVSGGHTQIVLVKDFLDMEVIGETQDDAVGEAFDKAAKMLGLGYPGGPMVDKLAKKGDPARFKFPETEMPGLNYSFSGIKTAILYFLRAEVKKNEHFIKENENDLCASIQYTLVKMLLQKLRKAARLHNIKEVAIAGGVSANSGLRNALEELAEKENWKVYIPAFEYCTDNAGMIAMTAHYKFLKGDFADFTLDNFAIALIVFAVVIVGFGYFNQHGGAISWTNIFGDFYANVSSELISIVITVLVLERLNNRRQDKQELTRLKALLGSNEAVVTKIAVAELTPSHSFLIWLLEAGGLTTKDVQIEFQANATQLTGKIRQIRRTTKPLHFSGVSHLQLTG